MIEKPYKGLVKIDSDGITIKITMPLKKNWFMISFLGYWMCCWFMLGFILVNKVLPIEKNPIAGFFIIWWLGWIVVSLFAIVLFLWILFGFEIISIDKTVFKIEKRILDFIISTKKYDLTSIRHFELNPGLGMYDFDFSVRNKKMGNFWGLSGGKLRFDYGMKTVRFGLGIDEAEARFLIDEIKRRGYYKEN